MAPIRSAAAMSSAAHSHHGFSRRRSSISLLSSRRKAPAIPKNYTFAPNVTPVSYPADKVDAGDENSHHNLNDNNGESADCLSALADPSMLPMSASLPSSASSSSRPRRRRRDSSGNEHIPRPPNAFMLYRQNFVHQRHVPGSIETNHNSLSRIVGDCWKQLPAPEKKVWEELAERKKAEHKKRYPDYRFQPKHDPEKKRRRAEARAAAAAQVVGQVHKGPGNNNTTPTSNPHLLNEGSSSAALVEPRAQRPHSGMNANMNMNAQPFHLGHRRSSSVPLPQEAFAYAQTHNVYPYMQQQQQHAQMGFGGGYDQHQQLQHQMHQHQQQQQTPQMDGWSQQQQHQQQMQHYAPPHSAAPHPGYTHVPLAHSFFPGAATNPFNFADPAVSGLRRNGGAGVANASAANGDDDQQGNGNGIALPTVPRLTGLTPSNAPPGEGSSPATQSLEPSSASTATPMLHQPSPFRLSLSNTTLFMPQPLNAGVTATSLSASGNSTAAQSTATANRFPSFLGRLPSFSMGIPLSFDTSGGSNTAEGGGEHGAAEGGEFMPPHSFYVNMGMPVDATGAFDGYHFGGNSGGGAMHAPSSDYNPRSLQQAALHQRQLTNLGRRASSTQPILERQRAYVLGQLGDGEGNNNNSNNHAHAGYDFSGYEMGMGTMGMFGGADAQHQQQQQPFGGVGADYYADYQHPRGGEEEMRGFRNPFASSSSSSVSAAADSNSSSSNAHHPLPSSNSSDTTTDSAGPASPSAVGETSSPAMGTSEKLEAVPPHQLPVHQQGQEHAVARGLELAAGAYPFVGHGDEGLVEGVGANEVNMERNSFDFSAIRHSLFPSPSAGASGPLGAPSQGQSPAATTTSVENVAPHERVLVPGYSTSASYTAQQQVRPQQQQQQAQQQQQFGYGVSSAVSPLLPSYSQQQQHHHHQKRVVSAPAYHGAVNGMEMLDSGYTPNAPGPSGGASESSSSSTSASGSPASTATAVPPAAPVVGDALGMYHQHQHQHQHQLHQQHDAETQYALHNYYAGLGDVRMAGDVDGNNNNVGEDHDAASGTGTGGGGARFSFSEYVLDSPRLELGRRTPAHVVGAN